MSNICTLNIISDIIDYIEVNITNPITLDLLSGEFNISKFHLHRMFKGLTNMPLIEYVRGRKLSVSLNSLKSSDLRIIDIANDYGFDYEQSYIRSFKKQFCISPSTFRKQKKPIKIVNKFDVKELKNIGDGVLSKPSFYFIPPFCVAGKKHLINEPEILKSLKTTQYGVDFFFTDKQNILGITNKNVYYGFSFYINNTDSYYLPSIEIDPKYIDKNRDYSTFSTQNNQYAVFKYIGFHKPTDLSIMHLKELYKYIFRTWFDMSNYRPADMFHFERVDLSICDDGYTEAELCFPVIEKS